MTFREARKYALQELLELYLFLHETDVPARSPAFLEFYRQAGFDEGDKTAFVQRL